MKKLLEKIKNSQIFWRVIKTELFTKNYNNGLYIEEVITLKHFFTTKTKQAVVLGAWSKGTSIIEFLENGRIFNEANKVVKNFNPAGRQIITY